MNNSRQSEFCRNCGFHFGLDAHQEHFTCRQCGFERETPLSEFEREVVL